MTGWEIARRKKNKKEKKKEEKMKEADKKKRPRKLPDALLITVKSQKSYADIIKKVKETLPQKKVEENF